MAIPDFQTVMLPLLEMAGDGHEHGVDDAHDALAQRFGLTADERSETLASGLQSRFDNRVGWARTYLKKAGLLETPSRGRFRITQGGIAALADKPSRIDIKYLRRFPEFREFQAKSRPHKASIEEPEGQPPEEMLDSAYRSLRQGLAEDLVERVKTCPPRFFESLVVDLLVAMGYGGSRQDAGQAVGRSGDGGIDGLIKEDALGLDAVYIQAKRWEGTVGRQVVQAFAGSLEGVRARKGVLITTSRFSPDATDYATKIEKRIVLIDGEQLAQLMIDHDIGVTEVALYSVKRIDQDYFSEE